MKHRGKIQQGGFSLIELMISLVIGLIVIAAITQVFVGSKVTYSMQSALSKLQENGRFAMSFITRDIRQAGYSGCSRNATLSNVLRLTSASAAPPSFLDFETPVNGIDAVSPSSDEVTVLYAESSYICDIFRHNTNNEVIRCQATNHPFEIGDIVVATDCEHTAVFQLENNGASDDRVRHRQLAGTNIENCTEGLGLPVDCSSTTGNIYAFDTGTVMALNSYRYYIANNSFGEPALFRDALSNTATGGLAYNIGTTANELVEGVEEMQILYGEDTSGDGTANYYVPFDEVSDEDDIISVRVSLLVRSIEDSIVPGGQTLTWEGAARNFADGRLRKVFTTTIALRNRL